MYIQNGMSKAQFAALVETLRTKVTAYASAEIVTLDGTHATDVPVVADGQVNMSVTSDGGGAQPDGGRSGNLTINDPARNLRHFEGINARKYMVRTFYNVRYLDPDNLNVPTWTRVEVGTGGMDTCSRNDRTVTVTWRGKAALAMHSPRTTFTVKKGVKKTTAIRLIMEAAGEDPGRMSIPDLKPVLTADYSVSSGHDGGKKEPQTYWVRAYALAHSLNLMLFYRANGILLAKHRDHSPVFTMSTAAHNTKPGWLTSQPVVEGRFADDFANLVVAKYGPIGHQLAYAEAPPNHPLSAQSLKRNGKLCWVEAVISNDYKTHDPALKAAKEELARRLEYATGITATCFPFPFLEQGDVVRFDSRDYSGVSTINTWSLPLGPGQDMTLGWNDMRSVRPL